MELTIALIRGGMTKSGKNSVLSTPHDENLTKKSANELTKRAEKGVYPSAEVVYTSPAACCLQTASLIYPNTHTFVKSGLDAYNYGIFAEMTATEIKGDKCFSDWAAAEFVQPFPDGLSYHSFVAGSAKAFGEIVNGMLASGVATASVVTHRLVIAVLLRKIHAPHHSYTDWTTKNGGGFIINYDSETSAGFVKYIF